MAKRPSPPGSSWIMTSPTQTARDFGSLMISDYSWCLRCRRQRAVDGGDGVDRRRIEQRDGTVFFGDEQHDFGAAKDDGLSALPDEAADDLAISRSRLWTDLAGNQLLVDDVVNDAPVVSLRH